MSKLELSMRAQKVLEWTRESCHTGLACPIGYDPVSSTGSRLGGRDDSVTLAIRQQTLADLLGCSRRSIYRALKQLKEQGYLVETGKRQNRCKVYQICSATLPEAPKVSQESAAWTKEERSSDAGPGEGRQTPLCEQAKFYLDNCQTVFKYNFLNWPDWEKFFPEATHRIRHVEHQTKFWRLMFDNLYLIQERETGKPHSARTDNPDSTLFGVSYPKAPPKDNLEHRMRTRPAYRPLR